MRPAQLSMNLARPEFEVAPMPIAIVEGATHLPGFLLPHADELGDAIDAISTEAPFRHMVTKGGKAMSAAMTNAGELGWVSDRSGYRYERCDPASERPWPKIPSLIVELATRAAGLAGFEGFVPDACLVNRYAPGARMSLHQDRDERDDTFPIVSFSLGLPAVFVLGGLERRGATLRIPLEHGDAFVFGGPSRLRHHGILPLKEGSHPRFGPYRLNLTLRRAS